MTDRPALHTMDGAYSFLTKHFGEINVASDANGVTCALPGFYFLHALEEKTEAGRGLRHLMPIQVTSSNVRDALIGLAETVNSNSLILKHAPKDGDLFIPNEDEEYVIIGLDDAEHNHGDTKHIDFNVASFGGGKMQVGSFSGDIKSNHWHTHLMPASEYEAEALTAS